MSDVPRVPDELLTARLPAPALRVWLAIRKRQGENGSAWYPAVEYARMAAVKEKDIYSVLALLSEWGWVERGEGKHISCLVGRPYTAGKRGGSRKPAKAKTTPKEGGTTDYPQRRGTTTPKEGGQTTPKEGTHTNPDRIQTESRHDSKRVKDETDLPSFIDPDLWKQYEQHRTEKKSKLTPTARRNALVKLTRFHGNGIDPNAAISQTLENGWTGIFEPKSPADTGGSGATLGTDGKPGLPARTSGRSHGRVHAAGAGSEIRGTAAERATVRTAKGNLELLAEYRAKHPERYGAAGDDEDGGSRDVARLGTGL